MGVQLEIYTRQRQYFAGDVVDGVVCLDVVAKGAEGTSADELFLNFVGRAKTRVPHEAGVAVQEEEILSYSVQLAAFGGKAASGTYKFPFSVTLPHGLPSSMEEGGRGQKSCAIVYSLKGRLHRPGMLHFDAKNKACLEVFTRYQGFFAMAPVTIGPETQKVTKKRHFDSGSMSIGFEVDRSVVWRNEHLRLTVVASNDSISGVKAMRAMIKEEVTWYTQGHRERRERAVVSADVSGTELGALQRPAEKEHHRGRGPATVYATLQDMLTSGAGVKLDLVLLVPATCHASVKLGIIEVKHTLSVTLETPDVINTSQVHMPLCIQ